MLPIVRKLSVVIPGLFGPIAGKQLPNAWQDLSLTAFELLLSRAVQGAVRGRGLEQTLFTLFKLGVADDRDIPIAAVTRQWDAQDAGNYWWLRADPVHLSADRDRILMQGNMDLNIGFDECQQLAAEIKNHFAEEAWQLSAVNPKRWYLRLESDPGILTAPRSAVVGQDILFHMPHGPNERYWRCLLNEMQMMLHVSTVNQSREREGLPPINSLWFWGGGRLPQAPQVIWSQVWGNDDLTRSLASLTGVPCAALPESATVWLENGISGEHLLVINALEEKIAVGNVETWRALMESIHENWLSPLFIALKQRQFTSLNIYPADGAVYRITSQDARRWWVRRRPLTAWL